MSIFGPYIFALRLLANLYISKKEEDDKTNGEETQEVVTFRNILYGVVFFIFFVSGVYVRVPFRRKIMAL